VQGYETRSVRIPEAYARFEADIRSREGHLDIVVVAWVVMGIFYVLYGLGVSALIVVLMSTLPGESDAAMRIVMPLVAVACLVACAGVGTWFLITAWGLHRRTRPARISSYVLAGLLAATICLLPLGIYAFWVLMGPVTDMAFGRFGAGSAGAPGHVPRTRAAGGAARPSPSLRSAEVLPPRQRLATPGLGAYPRPDPTLRTPPAGIPRYASGANGNGPKEQDITRLETVRDLPSPYAGRKKG
jgi:hypothetical protein